MKLLAITASIAITLACGVFLFDRYQAHVEWEAGSLERATTNARQATCALARLQGVNC
jgi:hypothetical protein